MAGKASAPPGAYGGGVLFNAAPAMRQQMVNMGAVKPQPQPAPPPPAYAGVQRAGPFGNYGPSFVNMGANPSLQQMQALNTKYSPVMQRMGLMPKGAAVAPVAAQPQAAPQQAAPQPYQPMNVAQAQQQRMQAQQLRNPTVRR